MSEDCLFSVCLTTVSALAELLEDAFADLDCNITSWEEVDTGRVVFQEYFETEDDASLRLAVIDKVVAGLTGDLACELELKRIENRDWTEYWKRFFHTAKVSERIVVKPSWEEYQAASDELVVEIDPGMSFGTGLHPSTRMCISILDGMSSNHQGSTFADLGCGSGILSIAAAKMGYSNVTGIDNDPLAVEIADANARLNSVAAQFTVGDMGSLRMDEQYDVVVINMLASLLSRFAEPAADILNHKSKSRLILSGMLKSQYDDTVTVYSGLGFRVLESYEQNDWKSALCCR